ncbi:MAG: peptidoglycan DD-metalloendopeptidase family protein [Rickettsiales bacterium]|jgi:murein DD-endopeptidase MepM/ murein hydrolase activator NlpD|nr:peptidoglycan DD-metalloendopeptidase family protein [Rickettsiales bacterium]
MQIKFLSLIFSFLILSGCGDLQPKIAAIPGDIIGSFISEKYPTLLADPDTQIYQTAAADYGTYEGTADLYGMPVEYSSAGDYTYSGRPVETAAPQITEKAADLDIPDYTPPPELVADLTIPERKKSEIIIVGQGDTLYSLSRRFSVPVNDLAVMNKLEPPFTLGVGQTLTVPAAGMTPAAAPAETTAAAVAELKKLETEKTQLAAENKKLETEKIKLEATKAKATTEQQWLDAEKKKIAADAKQAEVVKKQAEVAKAETAKKAEVAAAPKISSAPTKPLPKQIAKPTSSKFTWPVRGKIISDFGDKPGGLANDGINIAGTTGATVGAAENGVVAYAGNEIKGMGNVIILQHSTGYMSVYAHLDTMVVKRGAAVKVGQKLGTLGQTGKVNSPQLHFEIRKGTKAYNPKSLLK